MGKRWGRIWGWRKRRAALKAEALLEEAPEVREVVATPVVSVAVSRMSNTERRANYLRQTGRRELTPRQARRIRQKSWR